MSFAAGVWVACWTRTSYFDPDVTWRKQEIAYACQEVRKPFPDRWRQYQYVLPYHNHRLRNMVRSHPTMPVCVRAAKYRWALIDNEPDWADYNPL
eukprot:1020135-Amphidinium_carterae.1